LQSFSRGVLGVEDPSPAMKGLAATDAAPARAVLTRRIRVMFFGG